jgi:hypothetical protein
LTTMSNCNTHFGLVRICPSCLQCTCLLLFSERVHVCWVVLCSARHTCTVLCTARTTSALDQFSFAFRRQFPCICGTTDFHTFLSLSLFAHIQIIHPNAQLVHIKWSTSHRVHQRQFDIHCMPCICGHITKSIASTIVRIWCISWCVWTASCHNQINRFTFIIGCIFESNFLRATIWTFASKIVVDGAVAVQIEFGTTPCMIHTDRAICVILQMHTCLQQRQTLQMTQSRNRKQ